MDSPVRVYIGTNVNGEGELETLLKTIKSEASPYADCLDTWRECLTTQGKSIKDKEFDKFWVSIYQRFDTCTKEEQKQAYKNCAGELSMKKDIWNFEHSNLTDLKTFLQLFS